MKNKKLEISIGDSLYNKKLNLSGVVSDTSYFSGAKIDLSDIKVSTSKGNFSWNIEDCEIIQ